MHELTAKIDDVYRLDHTHCCGDADAAVVQRALAPAPLAGQELALHVFVDSGMIEAFSSGSAITALVSPDAAAGLPEARTSSVASTAAGVRCTASSFRLKY